MMIKAVLFSTKDVRIGVKHVSEDCLAIEFGGGLFVRTGLDVVLWDGERGVAFNQSEKTVIDTLDAIDPERIKEAKQSRQPYCPLCTMTDMPSPVLCDFEECPSVRIRSGVLPTLQRWP